MSRTEGFAIALAVVAALTAAPSPAIATGAEETDVFITPVYRVFNSYDGPHHFTTNIGERDDLVSRGWSSEPIAWYAPVESGPLVHRLYNPYSHEHLYTLDANEAETLGQLGWNDEGTAWRSDDAHRVEIYRLFNPNADDASAHHYTTDATERDSLKDKGWSDEGVCWWAYQSGTITPKASGEDGYHGFQNPEGYFQVSSKSVDIPHLGDELIGYRTESRIGPNATKADCVEAMIARAKEYLGTPYNWGYTNAPGVGVDCSGLVIQSLYATGMDLSPLTPWLHYYSTDFLTTDFMRNTSGFKTVPYGERERGDLVFYQGHVAIYLGNDEIIEAVQPSVRIREDPAYRPVIAVRRPFI